MPRVHSLSEPELPSPDLAADERKSPSNRVWCPRGGGVDNQVGTLPNEHAAGHTVEHAEPHAPAVNLRP